MPPLHTLGFCLALVSSVCVADATTAFIETDQHRITQDDTRESHLGELIATHPANASLRFHFGVLLSKEQRWGEARQAFARADELAPGQPDSLYNLAICLDHLEQTEAAIRHYRTALTLAATQPHNFPLAPLRLRLNQLQAVLP